MSRAGIGSICVDSHGKTYTLENKLGSGGEGAVFSIKNNPNSVAKIYIPEEKFTKNCTRDYMEQKIKLMLRKPVSNPYDEHSNLLIAWPTEILYCDGEFVGYLMPKITEQFKLFDMYRPTERVKIFQNISGGYTWAISYLVAISMAYAVKRVHEAGHLVGDMNPSNFFVTSAGTVILIDTDSFDIKDPDNGKTYKCTVAYEDYLAPELQGRRLSDPNSHFTKQTDYFGLAIHIFRLLMDGHHPFNCKEVTGAVSSVGAPKQVRAMANGECPYVRPISNGVVPDKAPKFAMLPSDIRNLFDEVFNYDSVTKDTISKRPSEDDWLRVLGSHYNASELKACSKNSTHVYFKSYGLCPWCEVESKIIIPTPVHTQLQTQTQPTSNTYTQSAAASTNNPHTYYPTITPTPSMNTQYYREASLLYAIYIITGIASGFFLGGPFNNIIIDGLDVGIPAVAVQIILAIIGGIVGGVIAYYCSERYKLSYRVWPWYLLALVLPIATVLTGGIIVLAILIIIGILYLIAIIIGLAIAAFCCCSSS